MRVGRWRRRAAMSQGRIIPRGGTVGYAMALQIGIVGRGVVGGAIEHGFRKLGHQIAVHDIALGTELGHVRDSEIVFLCVPTASLANGRCDTTVVEETVRELSELGYGGVVAIKSTVEPGTTEKLRARHPQLKLCFVPEFLRERCAITDFCEHHDLCVIGTDEAEIYALVVAAHGHYPRRFFQASPTAAELSKYFNNAYNALLITFANHFYELCQKLDVDYAVVKELAVSRNHINDRYLDCNDNIRGFGGVCLPKDLRALVQMGRELGVPGKLLETVIEDNQKYQTTVFDGMREGS